MIVFIIKLVIIILLLMIATIKEVLKAPYNWIRFVFALVLTFKLSESVYIQVFGDFNYELNLEFFLNSLKDSPLQYAVPFVAFVFFGYVFYRGLHFIMLLVFRIMSNKIIITFSPRTVKVFLGTIIRKLNIDGDIQIINGSISPNVKLKEKIPQIFFNRLLKSQVYTMVIIIESAIIFNNVYWVMTSIILFSAQLLVAFYSNKFGQELHRLSLINLTKVVFPYN